MRFFFKKYNIYFVLSLKKKKGDFVKKNQIYFFLCKKRKKKDFLKEDSHSWDKFIMHASQHIKKFNLTFNPFF